MDNMSTVISRSLRVPIRKLNFFIILSFMISHGVWDFPISLQYSMTGGAPPAGTRYWYGPSCTAPLAGAVRGFSEKPLVLYLRDL